MDDQSCRCLLCAAPPGYPEDAWDTRDRTTAARIRRYGWTVTAVTGGPAYSTGLWHTFRATEICVFGLPARLGTRIADLVGNLLRDGDTLLDGERRDDVLTGYDVVVRAARPDRCRGLFDAGLGFYRGTPVPITQIVWPDGAGRFPWEPGAGAGCRDSQPSLWLPGADAPYR
ncbi:MULTISPECIES: DUF4262 domain-containing protein [Catenuloplanes]|uniref:DUF4262 domain-containing protein n=1 Tax=Catenuloplanes niger TaxID=587534 RepID=A0AAE3ZWE7_9ACTN|nr:DUF4262 domain-containing protein [Catenuloplanes niger]MDR7326075.1 hypothetical protein [Catenuloplanes niger]